LEVRSTSSSSNFQVGEELAAAFGVVGGRRGEEDGNPVHAFAVHADFNGVRVDRRIGIRDAAIGECGGMTHLAAGFEPDGRVESVAQGRVGSGENVENLVGQHPGELGGGTSDGSAGHDDGVPSGVGRVAFLASRGLDEVDHRRQRCARLLEPFSDQVEPGADALDLGGLPLNDRVGDEAEERGFVDGTVRLHPGSAVERTEALDEGIALPEQFPRGGWRVEDQLLPEQAGGEEEQRQRQEGPKGSDEDHGGGVGGL